MATPALRLIRAALPGAYIAGLCKPAVQEILSDLDALDELLPLRAAGVMGTKRAAQHLRPLRFDTALLLTNSFSTGLITRIAGIPRRIGFDRDGRGMLLTHRLRPKRRRDTPPYSTSTTNPAAWAPVPAVDYYLELAQALTAVTPTHAPALELAITTADRERAEAVMQSAAITPQHIARGLAILNPGGNDPAKRWPAERFAHLADHLAAPHSLTILINGAPNEADLVHDLAARTNQARCICLPDHGITLGALKAIVAQCELMVTNDTGPRHIAAAFNVPTVSLFGPTDHRWTTIPCAKEVIVLADPTLPACEVANDHPERCAIEHIDLPRVVEACDQLLNARAQQD
ncbi:MAG: glycosyltransferase family 9 protein [Phycisphaerales bacterium]|nr:glycosyltransferase family 9 protein [Phycisphaerales bacterium]